jgi:hypothetical protein
MPVRRRGVARPWLVVDNHVSGWTASSVGSVAVLVTNNSRRGVVAWAGRTQVRDGGALTALIRCD